MSNDLTFAQRLEQASSSAAQSWLITEMLLNAYPPVIRESVIAVAVPHWFTVEILAALLDLSIAEAEARYAALQALSLVQPFGGLGCTLHDLTRNGILRNLVIEERALLQRYSKKLLTYFIPSDDPQREVERVYHLLSVNPDDGRSVLQPIARFWRSKGNFAAVENLLRSYRELIDLGCLAHEHALELEQQEYWTVVALADYSIHLFQELFKRFPKAQRQLLAVYYVYYMNLDREAVADKLATTTKNLDVLLSRGREKLKTDEDFVSLLRAIAAKQGF